MEGKKERNRYDLKEIENIKNTKIAWNAWPHNLLTEMLTVTKTLGFVYKK